MPVWNARPVHYTAATCKFDKVCLELLQKLKPLNSTGGNALEFSNPGFPNVQALLNLQGHYLAYPLAAAIVSVGRVSRNYGFTAN
jgi:hypothetical protein